MSYTSQSSCSWFQNCLLITSARVWLVLKNSCNSFSNPGNGWSTCPPTDAVPVLSSAPGLQAHSSHNTMSCRSPWEPRGSPSTPPPPWRWCPPLQRPPTIALVPRVSQWPLVELQILNSFSEEYSANPQQGLATLHRVCDSLCGCSSSTSSPGQSSWRCCRRLRSKSSLQRLTFELLEIFVGLS